MDSIPEQDSTSTWIQFISIAAYSVQNKYKKLNKKWFLRFIAKMLVPNWFLFDFLSSEYVVFSRCRLRRWYKFVCAVTSNVDKPYKRSK